jgi:hypothetical protein
VLIEKDFDQYGLEEITEGKIKKTLFLAICVCTYLTKAHKKCCVIKEINTIFQDLQN